MSDLRRNMSIHGWVWCEGVIDGLFRPRPTGSHTVCCDYPCVDHEDFACPGPHRPLLVDMSASEQPLEASDE